MPGQSLRYGPAVRYTIAVCVATGEYCAVAESVRLMAAHSTVHSAPLEMLYCLVLFFTEVKIFRFWQKTMDYNKAF